MKRIAVLTGAGMSAESGIRTFRDAGGLWEGYDVMKVASPKGWQDDPVMVLDFYNARRQNVVSSQPNKGHLLLAELQAEADIQIITQNIDDLHERAGSTNVLHLHGEITKCRSCLDESYVKDVTNNIIELGDLCPSGGQLRPHIVWFGEEVPMMSKAIEIVLSAEMVVVVGTSMEVYPAAGLSLYAKEGAPIYLIDPNESHQGAGMFKHIVEQASTGLTIWLNEVNKEGWL